METKSREFEGSTETPPAPTSQVLDDYEALCVRERRRTRMVMRLPKDGARRKGAD